MQDIHYNYIKNKHCVEAEILLCNTDCFRCKFQIENFTKSVTKFYELCDFVTMTLITLLQMLN